MEKYSRRKPADDRGVSPSASEASRRARPRKRQQPRRRFSQERCGRGEPPASGNEAGNGACCRKSAALVTEFGTGRPHGHPPPTCGLLARRAGACSANQDTAAGQRRVGSAVGVEEFCLRGSPRGQCTKTDLKVTVFTAVKPICISLGFRNGIRPPPSLRNPRSSLARRASGQHAGFTAVKTVTFAFRFLHCPAKALSDLTACRFWKASFT